MPWMRLLCASTPLVRLAFWRAFQTCRPARQHQTIKLFNKERINSACAFMYIQLAGPESVWSVDGELLANNHISAKAYRGLIEVFGRGVEM